MINGICFNKTFIYNIDDLSIFKCIPYINDIRSKIEWQVIDVLEHMHNLLMTFDCKKALIYEDDELYSI